MLDGFAPSPHGGRIGVKAPLHSFEYVLKLIVMKWENQWRPELKAEGFAQCRIELESMGQAMKLTITHSIERADSKLIEAVSGGWPKILSNLKSLLETGAVVLTDK